MRARTKQYDSSPLLYERALVSLKDQIEQASRSGRRSENVLALVKELITLGKNWDICRAADTLRHTFNMCVQRSQFSPPHFTSRGIMGQSWADSPLFPLEEQEHWNRDRRASNTGVRYPLDEQGLPINPFYNYGVKGRGVIGRYGPNHAVDIAPCRIMQCSDGNPALHILGIVREDNNQPAICGGFVDFERASDGTYPYPHDLVATTQTREFFEEVISGSVPLLDHYAEGLEDDIEQACAAPRHSNSLSPHQRKVIASQKTTHRKWQQVQKEDPTFLKNLHRAVAAAQKCYAGPVLGSVRNTNHAWMETQLSWFHLSQQDWQEIKGPSPKFNYTFSAGDDAKDALWHHISPDLITRAGDHGAFFCYVLASYLLHEQMPLSASGDHLKDQAQNLLETLRPKVERHRLDLGV